MTDEEIQRLQREHRLAQENFARNMELAVIGIAVACILIGGGIAWALISILTH